MMKNFEWISSSSEAIERNQWALRSIAARDGSSDRLWTRDERKHNRRIKLFRMIILVAFDAHSWISDIHFVLPFHLRRSLPQLRVFFFLIAAAPEHRLRLITASRFLFARFGLHLLPFRFSQVFLLRLSLHSEIRSHQLFRYATDICLTCAIHAANSNQIKYLFSIISATFCPGNGHRNKY